MYSNKLPVWLDVIWQERVSFLVWVLILICRERAVKRQGGFILIFGDRQKSLNG
jgi:hypothetical protein